jgi:16S rRNA (cytidine1402-2'-O)-methyltransferase
MRRIYSYNKDKGILYLVATPIGNMQDMTFRAVETLKSVDVIYAEDTRNSMYLLQHFNINTKLLSYHEFNKELKEDEIIERLKSGENVAIISDAGLPVISDPGFDIARAAIKNDIPVTPIPGASAGISGLIASGITPQPFTFVGFLDSKTTKRKKELEELIFEIYNYIP